MELPISIVRTTVRHVQRLANFAGRYAHAAGLVAYTFTLGLTSPRRRHLIAQLARGANYREFPRARLASVSPDSITNPLTSVVLPHPEASEGNVTLLELIIIARLARERAPSTLFEIGTFNGRTTETLAMNAPEHAVVYTLDLPAGNPAHLPTVRKERAFVDKPASGALLPGSPAADRIRQLFGDSATFDFSPYRADLVFVDGSHSYEYVKSDSERALTMLRDGHGLVLWHDYGEWEGVTRALNELQASDKRFATLRRIAGTALAVLEL